MAPNYPFPEEKILYAYKVSTDRAVPVPAFPVANPLVVGGVLGTTLESQRDVLLLQAVMAPPGDFGNVWDTGIAGLLDLGARAVIEERAANIILP